MMRVPWLANSFKISLLGFFPPLSLVFKIKVISYMHIVVLFYAQFTWQIISQLLNNPYQSYTILNIYSDNESKVTRQISLFPFTINQQWKRLLLFYLIWLFHSLTLLTNGAMATERGQGMFIPLLLTRTCFREVQIPA